MQRWVLHIDMDAFFASVEQLTRPTLRGRPVIVAGIGGRGVVAGASYEARALGAHSAMPTYRASALIGMRGVVVTPRHAVYSAASRRVFSLIAEHVDVVEQLSVDEAFMEPAELVGATPDEVRDWGNALRETIFRETGLPSSIGAGSGKQAAKIGSGLAKPNGICVIPQEDEARILHPLPVSKLWGVGPVTESKLRSIGVSTIGDLAAMSQKDVELSLGAAIGVGLWKIAQGRDTRVVAPRAEAKQVSAEHTFGRDLLTNEEVDEAIERAFQGAWRRLAKDGRGARTVTVKLKMADFHSETRSTTLLYPADNPETLLAAARKITRYPAEVGPIRLVGVGFSGLESARQDVLFPELDVLALSTRAGGSGNETDEFEPIAGSGAGASSGASSGSGAADDDLGEEQAASASDDAVSAKADAVRWAPTQDVYHAEFGHGWVQGSGHGVVSVRFETRATGPGKTRSFPVDDPDLRPGDPLDSLAWDLPGDTEPEADEVEAEATPGQAPGEVSD